MKLSEICELLDCRILWGDDLLDRATDICIASDLMSDVLARGCNCPNALLVTGLANAQAVRTADVADAAGVVFVRGKRPDQSVVELGREFNIPLLFTQLGMFDVCARLASKGIQGLC
jgi:predicted transcriptional regulator